MLGPHANFDESKAIFSVLASAFSIPDPAFSWLNHTFFDASVMSSSSFLPGFNHHFSPVSG